MFGMKPKRTGLFGTPRETYGTPGIGDDVERQRRGTLFGHVPQGAPPQEQPKKRSILPYALAALEDTLSRQMGYQPQGVARLNEMNVLQQEQAAELAAEQRKRSMEREDKRWEWDNKPQDPYRWRNNNGDLMEMGPDGTPRVAYDDPKDKTEWIRTVDPLTGAITLQPSPSGAAPPPDMLPPDFDFGDEGGPASQAPGNFPYR